MKKILLLISIMLGGLIMSVNAQDKTSGTLQLTDEFRQKCYESAVKVADWIVANQVKNDFDANRGRFLWVANPKNLGYKFYTGNWMGGVTIQALLMTYHRTGDKKYLDAAALNAEYLKSMQILDSRKPENYGAFAEETPQFTWCYTRDALTGALGLLWLYEETKDMSDFDQAKSKDYLERIKLFNEWFVKYAMANGWPAWSYDFSKGQNEFVEGSFHGGDALYFYDYYRITGDDKYLDKGVRYIVDYAMDKFVMPDGRVKVLYDPKLRKHVEDGTTFDGMQKMHRHNDDFMSISLLDAYMLFGDKKYLDRAEAYAGWLISEQRPDGGYGTPDVPPAAAVGPNFLIELYRITNKQEYLDSAIKGINYLFSRQELERKEKELYGGFYGYDGKWDPENKVALNLRTSAYALIALLKMEGKENAPYYSPFDRKGEPSSIKKNGHK